MLPRRALGRTGLSVAPVGLGAGRIGGDDLEDRDVDRLLDRALDAGVNLVDTARSYGRSEARIGAWLGRGRRDRAVISTKGGYGISGVADWTGPCVTRGVDEALGRLATDYVDVFLLHSCPRDVLERGEVIDALEGAVKAGKVRVMGYSGDGEALAWAVQSGRFGAVEASVNVCDQRVIDEALGEASRRGVGVIAKRPLANAPWRFAERPRGDYAEVYWERLRAMDIHPPRGMEWDEVAIRFSAFQPGVSAAIVGTARVEHLLRCVEAVGKGALPEAEEGALRGAFRREDRGWIGQV